MVPTVWNQSIGIDYEFFLSKSFLVFSFGKAIVEFKLSNTEFLAAAFIKPPIYNFCSWI
jgi:hypothetical protein